MYTSTNLLYEIKYNISSFCFFGIYIFFIFGVILFYIIIIEPIFFVLLSIPIYGLFIRLSLLLKEVNMKIYSDRVNISGVDYNINNIEYKEHSVGGRTTFRTG